MDQVIAKGYGKSKASSLGTLWPEDDAKYEFVDLSAVEASGVLSIVPKTAGFKKFYFVALRSGGGYTTSGKGLMDRGLVKLKTVTDDGLGPDPNGYDTPWPEHGSAYDLAVMAKRNIVSAQRMEVDGQHVYKLTVAESDGSSKETIVKDGYMRIMRFILK